MKFVGEDTILGIKMKVYKNGALTILVSEDDFDSIDTVVQNFGTFKMPLGKYKHASLSRPDRYPTWDEIKQVKEEVFGDEFVIQMLPPKNYYTNVHDYCFHLWQIL